MVGGGAKKGGSVKITTPVCLLSSRMIEFFTITQSWQCWQCCQLYIPIFLQFSSVFIPTDVNKWEIRNQGVNEDYISRLYALLDWLIFNAKAKTKLAMLPFLYWRPFVKNSDDFLVNYYLQNRLNQQQIVLIFINNINKKDLLLTFLFFLFWFWN